MHFAMTIVYAKFLLPWQPFQDVLSHVLVKGITLHNYLFFCPQSFINICPTSHITVRVRIPPMACEKVATNLGLASGFCRVKQVPLPFTIGLS